MRKRSLFTKSMKGFIGELTIKNICDPYCKKGKMIILNNITFSHDDTSTQIDHIIITRGHIFCIETKNFKGTIYGSATKETWYTYVRGKRYNFYNPLMQNYNHIKYLSKKLFEKFNKNYLMSNFVVFTGSANIDKVNHKGVLTLNEFTKAMAYFSEKNITSEEIELANNIKAIQENISTYKHIQNIQGVTKCK